MRAMMPKIPDWRWRDTCGGLGTGNPIDDCNQKPDAAKQIDGCTEFLTLEPESPYVALAYGLRGGAYQKEGDLNRAIADFNHAIEIDPPLVSRTCLIQMSYCVLKHIVSRC